MRRPNSSCRSIKTLHESTAELVETFRQVQQARRREQMQLKADGDTASKRDARREALAERSATSRARA